MIGYREMTRRKERAALSNKHVPRRRDPRDGTGTSAFDAAEGHRAVTLARELRRRSKRTFLPFGQVVECHFTSAVANGLLLGTSLRVATVG